MTPYLLLPVAYLLGATPTSLWVGRAFHGVDLRTEGSGNLGATNTFRVLGWKAALPVVVFDVFKGWLPTALFAGWAGEPSLGWSLAYGSAAIVGHVFSIWAGFRGGKGVATSGGVFLALAPWAVLVSAVVFAVLVGRTRIVSVGSLAAAAVLPVAVALTPHRGGTGAVVFAVVLAVFVIWAHRSNIERLRRGEENRFGGSGQRGPA
ncbi:MAG TPA: glycerol-3-phosphate 1-O-acyltransferase PlsY [Longimicrobiales bacterium]|nr:glycerol-3-phosphate 1-O-acyltransferase PlsY [Longimicrobiales bacterium]